jgi:bacterioferritin-associated ferredoxin
LKSESFKKIDLSIENFICLNPSCNVVYYTRQETIDKSELKRELWFKNGSKREIICYCNNIDSEQIKAAVTSQYLTTWEAITSYYRKKVVEKCEILNPTGYCCRKKFNEVVNKCKYENKST